jgi:adenosylmethionine-8-amino-7-oxononanoate aminotransferase
VSEWGNLIPRIIRRKCHGRRGEGIYIYYESGRAYIDGCSGALLSSVGHGNREIVAAMAGSLKRWSRHRHVMNAAALEAAKEAASIARRTPVRLVRERGQRGHRIGGEEGPPVFR